MSQYFTYNDLKGNLPIDTITEQPQCNTCGVSRCYVNYENISGISQSTHLPYLASAKQDKLFVNNPDACNDSLVNCQEGSLQTNVDPYNIITKTVGKCDISKIKYNNIIVPELDGSYDRNRVESNRYIRDNSLRNTSDKAAKIHIPKVDIELSVSRNKINKVSKSISAKVSNIPFASSIRSNRSNRSNR